VFEGRSVTTLLALALGAAACSKGCGSQRRSQTGMNFDPGDVVTLAMDGAFWAIKINRHVRSSVRLLSRGLQRQRRKSR
jgi:hypothetical protein